MRKPNYTIVKATPEYIMLSDNGPWTVYPTITNGAEEVVADLIGKLNGRRLFYYDSEGECTELLIMNGKFSGFTNREPF